MPWWPDDILCRWNDGKFCDKTTLENMTTRYNKFSIHSYRVHQIHMGHSVGPRFRSLIGDGQKYTVEKVDLQAGLQKVREQPWHWKTLVQCYAPFTHVDPCGTDMGVNENHKSQVIKDVEALWFYSLWFCCGTWHPQAGRLAKQLRCRQWMESGFGTAVVWQSLAALIGECGGSSLRPLAASMPAVRTGTAAIDRVPKYQTPLLRIFRGYSALSYSALSHSALDSSLVGVLVLQRHIACADMFCIRKIKDSIVR